MKPIDKKPVRQFNIVFDNYTDSLASSGFSSTLYQVFQEFRQTLDTFMAETINPEIVSFTAQTEKKIRADLAAVAEPYQSMAMDAIAEYHSVTNGNGMANNDEEHRTLLDLEDVKKRLQVCEQNLGIQN